MRSEIFRLTGYNFKNESLLIEALTHPSMKQNSDTANYERLEFLGDSILTFVISEMLFVLFPHDEEGALAKRRVALICGKMLSDVALSVGLGELIIMADGEKRNGGMNNRHNLENVMEALIAALYLDGGIRVARKFIYKYWKRQALETLTPPKDSKTALQEWAQGKKIDPPSYHVIQESGPAHKPMFTVEVRLIGQKPAQAIGSTKKIAEHKAAEIMIAELE